VSDGRLIGVDWGTSNLRIMCIAEGGAVLDSRSDRAAQAAWPQISFTDCFRKSPATG
jgi:2-keto-3-deoxy-galactonokinase